MILEAFVRGRIAKASCLGIYPRLRADEWNDLRFTSARVFMASVGRTAETGADEEASD